jgi:hypothetical protein
LYRLSTKQKIFALVDPGEQKQLLMLHVVPLDLSVPENKKMQAFTWQHPKQRMTRAL